MLDVEKDLRLIIDLGNSLSQEDLVSDPAVSTALSSAAQQHSDICPVILACQKSRSLRWLVKDVILERYNKTEKKDPDLAIIEIIAAVFNFLGEYQKAEALPPPNEIYPNFRKVVEMAVY